MNKLEVPGKFDRAARGYDLLVALNPGHHGALRRSARALGLRPGMRVLDLGCGTGFTGVRSAQVAGLQREQR